MILPRTTQYHFREQYSQGKWHQDIVSSALEQAQAIDHPAIWISYLDVSLATQGVTLDQWLNIANRHNSSALCSPKLLLRLYYLMLTPEIINSLSESCRDEYCKSLKTSTRYPYATLISNIPMSGYLGSRLTHYPGLLTASDSASGDLLRLSVLNKIHVRKAQTLASRVTTLQQLIMQTGAGSAGCKHFTTQPRIAVVGNSPVIKQENKGDEIDSADIVVRFNNSAVSDDNRRHCGLRTDLWVMSPSTPVHYCPHDASAIIVSGLHALTRPSFYWPKLLRLNRPLAEFPASIWYHLVSEFQAPPSAGALLLASLEALHDELDIRYYGFTTNHHDIHAFANHHSDPVARSTRHNWRAETDWLANRVA